VVARANKPISLGLASSTAQTARPIKRAQGKAAFQALASELIYGNYTVRSDQAHLSSSFSLDCDPLKLAWNRTQLISNIALEANTVYTTQSFRCDMVALASDLTLGGKLRDPNPTELDSRFTVTAEPYDFTKAEAHLQAFAFEVIVGSKITIDPYLRLTIDPETRFLVISSESRQLEVPAETRQLVIAKESRELEVKPENGLNIIQG
jgi:hypothetical protein